MSSWYAIFAVLVTSGLEATAIRSGKDGDAGFSREGRKSLDNWEESLLVNMEVLGAERAVAVAESCGEDGGENNNMDAIDCNASMQVVCRADSWGSESGVAGGYPLTGHALATSKQQKSGLVAFASVRAQHGRFASCMQMVERWERDFGITFDWVVKHRADGYAFRPWPRLKDLELDPRYQCVQERDLPYYKRAGLLGPHFDGGDHHSGFPSAGGQRSRPSRGGRSSRNKGDERSSRNKRKDSSRRKTSSAQEELLALRSRTPRILSPRQPPSSKIPPKSPFDKLISNRFPSPERNNPPRTLPLVGNPWGVAFGGIDWIFVAPRRVVAPLVARLATSFGCHHFTEPEVVERCKGAPGSECVLATWLSFHGVSLVTLPWRVEKPWKFCGYDCERASWLPEEKLLLRGVSSTRSFTTTVRSSLSSQRSGPQEGRPPPTSTASPARGTQSGAESTTPRPGLSSAAGSESQI